MAKIKKYHKIDSPNTYVIYQQDGTNFDPMAVVVKKEDLQIEKKVLEEQLALVPLTDVQKIAWCEANHPLYLARISLQTRLNLVNEYLANM